MVALQNKTKEEIPEHIKIIAKHDGLPPELLVKKTEDGRPLYYRATEETHPNLMEIHRITCERLGIDKPAPIYLYRGNMFPTGNENEIIPGGYTVACMANKPTATTIYSEGFLKHLEPKEFGAVHAHELQHSTQKESKLPQAVYLAVAGTIAALGTLTFGLTLVTGVLFGGMAIAGGLVAQKVVDNSLAMEKEYDSDGAAVKVWGKEASVSLMGKVRSFVDDPANMPHAEEAEKSSTLGQKLGQAARQILTQSDVNKLEDLWNILNDRHPDMPKRIAAMLGEGQEQSMAR